MNYTTCPKCQAEIESDSHFCDQCGAELFVCPKCGTLGKGKRCTRCGEPLVSVRTLASATTPSSPSASPSSASSISGGRPSLTGGVGGGSSSPSSSSSVSESGGSAAGVSSPSPSITTDIDKVLGTLDFGSLSGTSSPSPAGGRPSIQGGVGGGSSPAGGRPSIQGGGGGGSSTIRPGSAPSSSPRQVPGHLVCRTPQLRLYIDDVIIGRREGGYASVFAAFGMVSGRHAQISRTQAGGWQVMDLGSTNGTFLNGQPLAPHTPVPFWVGDTITFADITFEALP